MKTLLTLFVLLFSSSVLADDISDFEIEGMSIGDSLLEYYSKQEIKDNLRKNSYIDAKDKNKYYHIEFISSLFNAYEAVQGPRWWMFEGKNLRDIRREAE